MVTLRPKRRMMPCYYAGSLNGSGVTINKCARDSGLKSRSANNTESMRFVSTCQFSKYNRKEFSASRELSGVQYSLKIHRRKVYSITEK